MSKYEHTAKTVQALEDHIGQYDGDKTPYVFKKDQIKIFSSPVADHLINQSAYGEANNRQFKLVALDTQHAAPAAIQTPTAVEIFVCQNKNPDGETFCGAKFPVGSQSVIDHLVGHRLTEKKVPETAKAKKTGATE